jgi:hypothetical protein
MTGVPAPAERTSLAAWVFVVAGMTATLVGAVTGVALRIVDRVPAIPDRFGFSDVALVGFELMGIAFAAVGSLLVIRRPRNAIGWCMVVIGVGYGLGGAMAAATFSIAAMATESAMQTARFTGWLTVFFTTIGGTLFIIPFIFPTGRGHTMRWNRFVRVCAISWPIALLMILFQPGPLHIFPTLRNPFGFGPDLGSVIGMQPSQLYLAGLPIFLGSLVWSLVSRYRLAAAMERQQLKWFALAIAVSLAALSVAGVSAVVSDDPPEAGLAVFGFAGALAPVAIGIAILRHHLYDIDRIISRTIAYAIVTGTIGVVFLALLLVLTTVTATIAGGETIAVAASTLAAFALFQPLRRRVQGEVDRRFDRSRYDAEFTVHGFGARLRGDLDMDTVRAEIVATAGSAVRPTKASLWLRGTPR